MIRLPRLASQDADDDVFGKIVDAVLPGGKGLVAVLHAYFDESGTDDRSPVMCVAGYLFREVRAKRFSAEWRRVLAQEGLEFFHMSECTHGARAFKNIPEERRIELGKRLISLIRDNIMLGVAVSVSEPEFIQRAPTGWISAYGSAYTACLHFCLTQIAVWAIETRYDGDIAYFFESGHKYASEANARLNLMAAKSEDDKQLLRYASHSFVNKRQARPIDAADYLAWHVHKYHIDSFGKPHGPGRRDMRRDFAALLVNQREALYRLRHLTGDELQRFFASQAPPRRLED